MFKNLRLQEIEQPDLVRGWVSLNTIATIETADNLRAVNCPEKLLDEIVPTTLSVKTLTKFSAGYC